MAIPLDDPLPMMALVANLLQVPLSELLFTTVCLIVLLGISAFISGSEVAFFSLKKSDLNDLIESDNLKEKTILSLMAKPKQFLATLLIANNFVNITIIILSFYMVSQQLDFSQNPILGYVIQTIVITFLIVLFGEIMPKVYSNKYPLKMATKMSRPLRMIDKILAPLSRLLVKSSHFIDARISTKEQQFSIEELTDAIELTYDVDADEEEKDILKGIVSFGGTTARQIMQSRQDMVGIDATINFPDLLAFINTNGYSRYPVYEETFDKVIGMLYLKDLLPHLGREGDIFDWKSLMRQVFFIPESKKIDDLLKDFQRMRTHIAIVVDEYGGCSGLVTLEDILEEIVGDIRDEFDEEEDEHEQPAPDKFVFEGKTLLTDVMRIAEIERSELDTYPEETESLAGLVLELTGNMPEVGDECELGRLHFLVKEMDHRRIKKVEITVNGERTHDDQDEN